MTIYFLKDIIGRKKAWVHNDDVKTCHVPQYKRLSIDKIMEFLADKPMVDVYFPDEPDMPKVPKQWIVNVCAAVLGNVFKQWVAEQIEERNAEMADKRDLMIAMDPHMAAKFQASTHMSRKLQPFFTLNDLFLWFSEQRHLRQHAQDELEEEKDPDRDPCREGLNPAVGIRDPIEAPDV